MRNPFTWCVIILVIKSYICSENPSILQFYFHISWGSLFGFLFLICLASYLGASSLGVCGFYKMLTEALCWVLIGPAAQWPLGQ